jgi:hypothetical protein
VGSYAVDTTNVERWGFSGGAAGYKIYYNSDTPVAGHASFVFDSAPRRAFALGWCPHQGTRPQQPWSQAFLWFAIHNTQLSDAAVAAWMADPYA